MHTEITPYGLTDAEQDIAEQAGIDVHKYLNDHVSGAVKKITDDIHQSIHDYVLGVMESDTRCNFSDLVRNRVNTVLQGLLSGGWAEMDAKKWLDRHDFEKYRKDIYIANKDVIQNKLIDDLLKENEHLKKMVEWNRRTYS